MLIVVDHGLHLLIFGVKLGHGSLGLFQVGIEQEVGYRELQRESTIYIEAQNLVYLVR